ncbi:MAG: type III-B CRISPR module RAMP protein Cmr1 [Anaerolineae bacterium]|nr:type III-B CRISPR module RAMP protein Cmr1 [Anaerolineae bacterium]
MAKYDFTLSLVSPAFIAGTDKSKPEMRAPSIRGHLRYWYRAIRGASVDEPGDLFKQESKAFGSTEEGNKFTLLIVPKGEEEHCRVAMLPHKSNSRERSETQALKEGQLYVLSLISRPGQSVSKPVIISMAIWSLLGGLGRRSRRMFGAVHVVPKEESPAEDLWYDTPKSVDELVGTIRDILHRDVKADDKLKDKIPDFPTLHPNHSWVIVGKEGYESDNFEGAVTEFFHELLRREDLRKKERSFGYAGAKRRASTIHAQLRLVNNQLYPVLTAFRSKPEKDIDWQHLKKFMEEAQEYFKGETVWGGW